VYLAEKNILVCGASIAYRNWEYISVKESVRMQVLLRKFWNDDRGQDIAEYALMLAVILLIVVGSVTAIGNQATTIFNSTAGALTAS
jgi:Flp pilus assembly pilin Flp